MRARAPERRRGAILALALASGVWASPARGWAQPLDPQVEALLRQGIEQRVQGHDEDAIERFERAYRLLRAPVTAGQLALACQAAGRWVEADQYMREALAAPEDAWVRRHRRELDEAYAVLRRNVGELELRGGPEGAVVRVEGVVVGRLPLASPLRLRAGAVNLEVRADGYFTLVRQVTILGDELTLESLQLNANVVEPPAPPVVPVTPPVAPVAPTPGVRVTPAPRRIPTASWVLGASGLALGAGGFVALGVRESAASRFNTECSRDRALSVECEDLQTTGGAALSVEWTGFVGGAALAATAVMVAVLGRREAVTARAWACAPAALGAGCVVSF